MLTQNPSTFLHFPSPFFLDYDDDLVHNNGAFPWDDPIFMQEDDLQIFTPRESVIDPREGEIEPVESLLTDKNSTLRKKRHGKKDRHSKIYTARGLRDRRMRLSLEVARRFFDLQDMLGFDKASKTIEWLFSKSKGPIRELAEKASSCSFPAMIYTSSSSEMRRLDRKATWLDLDPVVKRELRHKARERARERTKQKLKTRLFSGNHNKEETILTSNNQVSDQYQDDQNSCPADSTFVPGKYSSDICAAEAAAAPAMSTNTNLFINSVLPMNQLMIGHDQETQYFSFLITNYLSTSIFGSI